MRLMFLTFSTLSSNAGHLARLSRELKYLSQLNEISIVCLGKNPDDENTKKNYENITFFHYPVEFNGWEVKDQSKVVENINSFITQFKPDAVILQMEIWDLMRELGKNLKGKVPFATVVHAMPFLVSPTNPSGDFKKDVEKYANSGISTYRKDYLLNHYQEVEEVFKNVRIIANNKTVAFYFNTYFKNLPILVLPASSVVEADKSYKISSNLKYDFAYMARMEKGKGVEYLEDILKRISIKIGRKVKIVILGRADDSFSKQALAKLVSNKSKHFEADYEGWADDSTKNSILPSCGVFLYPSHYDNYPTVVNEALALGLPVITWSVPFSKLNYSATNAVKKVKLLNFQKFANLAVESLKERNILSTQALNFIKSFKSVKEVSRLDTKLFENLSKNE
ncbi:MAG TPA: glycosyltransferase family 4 protein [Patescibacteria group bacterium]